MMTAAISGFLMGGTLIIAVGAQNSFLIEQSLKRQWAGLFVALFILSDAIAISFGAMGFGLLLQQQPTLVSVTKWSGVIFLLWLAFNKLKASMANDAMIVALSNNKIPFHRALLTALGVTWLNPHFYIDTVLYQLH